MSITRQALIDQYLMLNHISSGDRNTVAKVFTKFNKTNPTNKITMAEIIKFAQPFFYQYLLDRGINPTDIKNDFRCRLTSVGIIDTVKNNKTYLLSIYRDYALSGVEFILNGHTYVCKTNDYSVVMKDTPEISVYIYDIFNFIRE